MILATKGTPTEEQAYWQHTILDQTGTQYLHESAGEHSRNPEMQPTA